MAVAACGGGATGPSSRFIITSIKYERVYAPSSVSGAYQMLINVSLPEHKTIPFCFPVQQSSSIYVCDGLSWELSAGEEAAIFVGDPALNRQVATSVFVNGIRITRVVAFSNGGEVGYFHLSGSGGLE